MQLALFTPGASIWPVHRNFEAFIAELGTAACDARDLLASPAYPVSSRSESGVQSLSGPLEQRLFELHQDLYRSLLRPAEFFHAESRSFAEMFWPDLIGTAPAQLLSTLIFHFIERPAEDCSVNVGLRVLRGIFFQHEMADPSLWIYTAREKLAAQRGDWSCLELSFDAPPSSRLHDLAFSVQAHIERPVESSGCFSGHIQRLSSGQCRVELRVGADRGMLESDPQQLRERCLLETRQVLAGIFGWREAAA